MADPCSRDMKDEDVHEGGYVVFGRVSWTTASHAAFIAFPNSFPVDTTQRL